MSEEEVFEEPDFMDDKFEEFSIAALTVRGISVETCRRYGYGHGKFNKHPARIANWYDDAGNVVAQKIRTDTGNPKFSVIGKIQGLYGKTRMRGEGRMIVVTEGEEDCLAVSEVLGNKWPVVSLPQGADNAAKWIKKDLAWLEKFDKIVLCFDSDDAGRAAVASCRELFSPGKCHVAQLTRKDPCEFLKAGDRAALVEQIWGAQKWTPAGILSGDAILRAALDNSFVKVECGWPWPQVDAFCRGMRYRELVTLASGTGGGKSTFCRALAAHFLDNGITVGYLALEENPRRTALGIYGQHARTNLHIQEDVDSEAVRAAHEAWGPRLHLFDHFGSKESDSLISAVRYMIVGLECRVIVLDHLSIVVSGLDIEDERKALDVCMTKLRTLVEETGVLLLLVSHLKRPPGKGHEEGELTSLAHLRGTAGIGQMSDMVIGLERDQQADTEEERNTVKVRILKSRFSGRTGLAASLRYDLERDSLEQQQDFEVDDDL